MGLGLLYLIAKGREDLYMVQDPNITFFKIVYKKHTNFSIECIDQYFKTIPDFGRRVNIKVSKNADLMGEIYLKVNLPSIPTSVHPEISHIKKFAWVKRIGLAMIKYVDIIIGGIQISRNFSDWLHIWNEINMKEGHDVGYNKMIGNVDINTLPTNGKDSYELTVPINFWFTRESGLYLPLISIYHHDIMIEVEFNEIEKLYITNPSNYITIDDDMVLFNTNEILEQKVNNSIFLGKFIYYDIITKKLYYNKIKGDFILDSKYDIMGRESNFKITPKNTYLIIKDYDYFNIEPSIINAYMMINYVYLDNMERQIFRESDHMYLIELPQKIPERIISNNQSSFKLNLKNPIKMLVFYGKLLSNLENNDYFNYSINPIDTINNEIIEKVKLNINSIDRVEIYDFKYFSHLEKLKAEFKKNVDNIGIYSFGLSPLDYQPSGTMNFSMVDDAYIGLTLNKNVTYDNMIEFTCYGLEYNILRVIDGLAGLAFYN